MLVKISLHMIIKLNSGYGEGMNLVKKENYYGSRRESNILIGNNMDLPFCPKLMLLIKLFWKLLTQRTRHILGTFSLIILSSTQLCRI